MNNFEDRALWWRRLLEWQWCPGLIGARFPGGLIESSDILRVRLFLRGVIGKMMKFPWQDARKFSPSVPGWYPVLRNWGEEGYFDHPSADQWTTEGWREVRLVDWFIPMLCETKEEAADLAYYIYLDMQEG